LDTVLVQATAQTGLSDMPKSTYLKNKVLDHVLGATVYVTPPNLYLALYTTAPTDLGGGVEVSAPSYARVAVANNGVNWLAAANGEKTLSTQQNFAQATENWGTIVAVGIFDGASLAANLLYWAMVDVAQTITTGDVARFVADSLLWTEA
jgi:hypothetical protein